jgi:hypothetical protein
VCLVTEDELLLLRFVAFKPEDRRRPRAIPTDLWIQSLRLAIKQTKEEFFILIFDGFICSVSSTFCLNLD